jgi:hypothetical protein
MEVRHMCELKHTIERINGESDKVYEARAVGLAEPFKWARDRKLCFRVIGPINQKALLIVKPSGMDEAAFENLRLEFDAQIRVAGRIDLEVLKFPPGTYNFKEVIFDEADKLIKLIYAFA